MRRLALLPMLLAAGCTVGPDYAGAPPVAPAAVAAPAFHRAEAATPATAPPLRWWTGFGDPKLAALIERGLADSSDIAVALARVAAARAALGERRAAGRPSGGLGVAALDARFPPGALGLAGNGNDDGANRIDGAFYGGGLTASWEIDLFGGQARGRSAARGRLAAADADLDAARLLLATEIATAYVDLRNYQRGVAAIGIVERIDDQLLALTRQRAAAGTVSRSAVETLVMRRESTQLIVADVARGAAEALDRLALLLGVAPGTLDADLAMPLPLPLPPAVVPVGDPAALLRHRPDVRAAERRLQAATADIGVYTAQLFPTVRLFGVIGLGGSGLDEIGRADSVTSLIAPTLQWSILDLGRVHARIAQADAHRDEALANYRHAVIAALVDAETGLTRYARQREVVFARARAMAAADRGRALAAERLRAGTASRGDALEAERIWAIAAITHGDDEAELSRRYVALQKSLGLGWQSDVPAP